MSGPKPGLTVIYQSKERSDYMITRFLSSKKDKIRLLPSFQRSDVTIQRVTTKSAGPGGPVQRALNMDSEGLGVKKVLFLF